MADMAVAYGGGGGGYLPDDARIRREMEELMKVVDLETMSTKQFISALSERFGGVDLTPRKKFIKATITEIIDSMERQEDGEGSDDDDEDASEEEESEEEPEPPKPKKKRSSGGGGGSATGGLGAAKEISRELADLLGSERRMARTAIVKGLWDYIKEHDLQNPRDKREILLDARMKAVFGCDSFTMFSMNKYISAHVEPYKPVDLSAVTPLTATSSSPKKRKARQEAGGKGDAKKKSPGLQAPWRLSEELAAVAGKGVLPRPQVTQALWAYIRENNLQNPKDKREIICDDALSRVMGGQPTVTMFSMNKYITPHLLEKLDKSAYVHEDIDTKKEDESEEEEEEESDEE